MRFLILYLFFYAPVFFAQQAMTPSDSAAYKKSMAAQKKVQAQTLETLKKESQKNLAALLEKFTFKKVEGSDKGWYHHKAKKDSAQSWLEAPVNASGYIYLKARYTGTVQYTVYSITVKANHNEGYSTPLVKDSRYIFRRKKGNLYNEVLHLFWYSTPTSVELNNVYILEIIAKADLKQKVVVKFKGEKDNYEFTLSKENVAAIKDSWNLSQYLCYKQNNYRVYSAPFPHFSKTRFSAFLVPKEELTTDDMKGIDKY